MPCSYKSAVDEAHTQGESASAVDQLIEEAQAVASDILAALRGSAAPSSVALVDAAAVAAAPRQQAEDVVLRQRLQALAGSQLESSSQVWLRLTGSHCLCRQGADRSFEDNGAKRPGRCHRLSWTARCELFWARSFVQMPSPKGALQIAQHALCQCPCSHYFQQIHCFTSHRYTRAAVVSPNHRMTVQPFLKYQVLQYILTVLHRTQIPDTCQRSC